VSFRTEIPSEVYNKLRRDLESKRANAQTAVLAAAATSPLEEIRKRAGRLEGIEAALKTLIGDPNAQA